jgi:hypothetical protein
MEFEGLLNNNTTTTICQGDISNIPRDLLRYIATSGECPRERIIREQTEDKTQELIISDSFSYGVFDTVEQFVNFYFGPYVNIRRQYFTELLEKIFADTLPSPTCSIINSRGNGLCVYNCLYMFLKLSRPDILVLFSPDSTFTQFRENLYTMAINSLPKEIKDFMIPLISDPSTPDLDPIFTSFVDYTGINVLMININSNNFTYNISKFDHKDFPNDYIVFIRNSSHLMFYHTCGDYTERQRISQVIEKNCLS